MVPSRIVSSAGGKRDTAKVSAGQTMQCLLSRQAARLNQTEGAALGRLCLFIFLYRAVRWIPSMAAACALL